MLHHNFVIPNWYTAGLAYLADLGQTKQEVAAMCFSESMCLSVVVPRTPPQPRRYILCDTAGPPLQPSASRLVFHQYAACSSMSCSTATTTSSLSGKFDDQLQGECVLGFAEQARKAVSMASTNKRRVTSPYAVPERPPCHNFCTDTSRNLSSVARSHRQDTREVCFRNLVYHCLTRQR